MVLTTFFTYGFLLSLCSCDPIPLLHLSLVTTSSNLASRRTVSSFHCRLLLPPLQQWALTQFNCILRFRWHDEMSVMNGGSGGVLVLGWHDVRGGRRCGEVGSHTCSLPPTSSASIETVSTRKHEHGVLKKRFLVLFGLEESCKKNLFFYLI